MFGSELVPLQLTFNEPLNYWTEYETGKSPIPYSLFPIHDIKFIWEPARFGWAFTLGRAYHVTQNEKYAEAFWKYFETFSDGNPPYFGPHWMNGQEIAIRLMALVWCAQVFDKTQSEKRNQQLIQSITDHALRIPPTLIYARSQNNNHLVVEIRCTIHSGRCARSASMARAGLVMAQSGASHTNQFVWRIHPTQHKLSSAHAADCFVGGYDFARPSSTLAFADARSIDAGLALAVLDD